MPSNQLKNQHLLWRAGFGPAAADLSQIASSTPKQVYQELKNSSTNQPAALDATDDYLKNIVRDMIDGGLKKKMLDAEERKNIVQQTRYAIRKLNLLWLDELVTTKAQLREKLAFFWHGHFASRNQNVFSQQDLVNFTRTNSLGSFRDLLFGVSKSAAMLNFLNANQNRKDHPNENFAREVMELFTLGRGNYTEHDIKEAARAFTGWGANPKGEFTFRRFQHDTGSKTVLGRTGNFSGEDVLNILLDQKQTALYITQKLYRFFVNENTPDPARINKLAEGFYQSNYNISALLDNIFTSDWFYDEVNIGSKIKSPVELLAGIRRTLPMELDKGDAQLLLQRVLGQVLFYPPNVAGWPGGKSWIDSSTLMFRMRIPQMINDKEELAITPKMDDDQMMGMKDGDGKAMGKAGKPIDATIHWDAYIKSFEKIPREQLIDAITASLLQMKPGYSKEMISFYADAASRESFVKTATMQIMSTPEYQLC